MTVNLLAVVLHGKHIADVERTSRDSLRLTYLSDPGPTPLSLSLPASEGVITGARVRLFLRGLLPTSGRVLASVGAAHGISPEDTLGLLSVMGKECAGAVQFCTHDELSTVNSWPGFLEPASEADIEARLSELEMDEQPSWMMKHEHWSLGGSNTKFTLRLRDGSWYYQTGFEPSTHIVKPGIHKAKHQALIEHVTTDAARRLGVRAAHTEYRDFKSSRAIVVARYDRQPCADGSVLRIHQEDLTQALRHEWRFEEFGGPSVRHMATLLGEAASTAQERRENLRHLRDMLLFHVLTGDTDAHSSNYSVLLRGDSVMLAPMYDAASSLPYDGGKSLRLAQAVGGEYDIDKLGQDNWRALADDLGLPEEDILDRLRELGEGLPGAASDALREVDDWDGSVSETRERFLPRLRDNVKGILGRAAWATSSRDDVDSSPHAAN